MRTLVYPTADQLRTRRPYGLTTPAGRIAQSYVVEPSGCWHWTAGLTSTGYGHPQVNGHRYQAHLLVYILEVGPLPAGDLEPDHLCRNRWCVNPRHLEFVTHAVNVQRGSQTRLAPSDVLDIRREVASGISQRQVGRNHGIDHSTVSRIVRRRLWSDVDELAAAA